MVHIKDILRLKKVNEAVNEGMTDKYVITKKMRKEIVVAYFWELPR